MWKRSREPEQALVPFIHKTKTGKLTQGLLLGSVVLRAVPISADRPSRAAKSRQIEDLPSEDKALLSSVLPFFLNTNEFHRLLDLGVALSPLFSISV
jgi:hypothetical protein